MASAKETRDPCGNQSRRAARPWYCKCAARRQLGVESKWLLGFLVLSSVTDLNLVITL